MAETKPIYVLDSYALLAYFQAEPGGASVRDLLHAAQEKKAILYLSLINAGEVYYLGCRFKGPDQAAKMIRDIRKLPIATIAITEERVWAAARLKAEYPIAYADAFAAALTIELGAQLVTGDPEFRSLETILPVKWLPGK